MLLALTFFEYLFLRLLGLQYDSISTLLFFFVVYLFLEIPLSLIANAIPKALKSVGLIKTSKGWLSLILNVSLTFLLIELLDSFMANIEISMHGAFVFALVTGFLNWELRKTDKEVPDVDQQAFKEIERKYDS